MVFAHHALGALHQVVLAAEFLIALTDAPLNLFRQRLHIGLHLLIKVEQIGYGKLSSFLPLDRLPSIVHAAPSVYVLRLDAPEKV